MVIRSHMMDTWHMMVTRQSHDTHMTVTRHSHDGHTTHDGHMTFTWQSHDTHMMVIWQSHETHRAYHWLHVLHCDRSVQHHLVEWTNEECCWSNTECHSQLYYTTCIYTSFVNLSTNLLPPPPPILIPSHPHRQLAYYGRLLFHIFSQWTGSSPGGFHCMSPTQGWAAACSHHWREGEQERRREQEGGRELTMKCELVGKAAGHLAEYSKRP